MKTCKDCLHNGICTGYIPTDSDNDIWLMCASGKSDRVPNIEDRCVDFKDKSRFVELPCSVGDKVYTVVYQKVHEAEVICIRPFVFKDFVEFRGNIVITFENPFYNDGRLLEQEIFCVFGKDTFLTREEAEKKLEELNGKV